MQGIPPPAECRVQGFVIEALEPELNFRRRYTLRVTGDLEDKTQLLPYLRATQDTTMATRCAAGHRPRSPRAMEG